MDSVQTPRPGLTLRARLLLLWLFMIAVCGALAYIARSVYELGAEAQTGKAVALATQACKSLGNEYLRASKPSSASPDAALMNALLNALLDEAPGVEGGFWHVAEGFVAYAFPTYQGSGPKTDIPATERERIERLVRSGLSRSEIVLDSQPGSRETVVTVACPLSEPQARLGAWTMVRVPVAAGRAYDELTRGLGLLLAFAVGSGLWLSYSFYRWTRQFGQIEEALRNSRGEGLARIPQTGDAELDRIVAALNEFGARLSAAQAQADALRTALERQERFAALGRMAASVAHEVRNPIAAMRLKVENARLRPERHGHALEFVLGEIDRLEGLVRKLLARAEPVRIRPREVEVGRWLAERVGSFAERSSATGVKLSCASEAGRWSFDPEAIGRALDNLIDNALDHARQGGTVSVEARAKDSGSALVIAVSDDGPGVAPGIRERLFEPFVSGRPDGIGLGLALAREIVRAHGGELRCVAVSAGARFEMEIPWPASS